MFLHNIILVLAVQLSAVLAQTLPFQVTGFLDSATPNSGDAINRGGTVQISGFSVKIPDNLLVEFPALFVPFAEFCGGQKAGPNEVSITGNIVGDVIIAGQMNVAQLDLAAASGVIERLDFDGAIKIKNGPTLRINDPNAKYSKGFTALPFFTADDENPSITSFSGFPVCVPRELVDPKCPLSNRPTAATSIPDALHMAPLKVGDYIEYSGVQYNGETIVYGLVANIDIRTSGTQPGFIRVEDAIVGVADTGADVEAARHRFIGLASRSDQLVSIYAVDQDPCTGKETERFITSVTPEVSNRAKWKIDVPRNTNNGYYTRNYHVKIGNNIITTTDGIKAGLYVQPVSEWIFPELVTPGGAPPPISFDNFGHLVNGFGPIDGTIFGPLRPWPGATTPAPAVSNCPTPPAGGDGGGDEGTPSPSDELATISARAGIDQTLLGGLSVQLSAKNDTGSGNGLTYLWSQIAGPTVTLSSNSTADVIFAAPVVSSNTNVQREFRVIITHTASGNKGNDTVVITTVSLSKAQTLQTYDKPVINGLTWASKQSGTATGIASSNLVDSTASMRIIFNSDNVERVMTKVGVSNGITQYSFNSRSIKSYTSATVRSYLNNVAVGGPTISSSVVSAG